MTRPPTEDLRVVVTGSAGRLGRVVMKAFDEAGLSCRGVDSAATVQFRPDGDFVHRKADLKNYGDTLDALSGGDVVVHLANISYPGFYPDHQTFTENVGMNYNVFSAASALNCRRVIWMSTANVAGIDTDKFLPESFPITEDQPPRLSSAYALSKSVSESIADYFGSSFATRFVGIRSALVVYPEDHKHLQEDAGNAEIRQWQYWSYIDVRDLTDLILLAATSTSDATTVVNATATDSILLRSSVEHCAEYFPDTPCDIEPQTTNALFSGAKAKQLFGFEAKRSWRQ
ncbi:MAG: NAD(P)-dependent oxidoreductase [Pseudomonadota bacterium]